MNIENIDNVEAVNVLVSPLEITGDVDLEGDLDMKENNILNVNSLYVDELYENTASGNINVNNNVDMNNNSLSNASNVKIGDNTTSYTGSDVLVYINHSNDVTEGDTPAIICTRRYNLML